MGIKVEDAMTRSLITCEKDMTVRDISKKMGEYSISSVIVENRGGIIGIVTEHDIVSKVIASGGDPVAVRAQDIMSKPVVTVDSGAEIEEAARLMRDRRIKKLVVVANGGAVGIISSYDLVVAEPVVRLYAEKEV